MYKNSFITQNISIVKTGLFVFFLERNCDTDKKHGNTMLAKCRDLNAKPGASYSKHWAWMSTEFQFALTIIKSFIY